METTWKAAYKMLQVTGAGLDHEEIWPTPVGDKLQDVWEKVKKKCPLLLQTQTFCKKTLNSHG